MPTSSALPQFLAHLSAAEHIPRPATETWDALVARIQSPGRIAEIDEETFEYFLDVLPPKFQSGSLFAFAEGAQELWVFWRSGTQFFCRQLTWDETKAFCRLSGTPIPYWF